MIISVELYRWDQAKGDEMKKDGPGKYLTFIRFYANRGRADVFFRYSSGIEREISKRGDKG